MYNKEEGRNSANSSSTKNGAPVQIQAQLVENSVVTRAVKRKNSRSNLTMIIRRGRKLSTGVRNKESWRKLFESENFKTIGFHIAIIAFCVVYVSFGAMVFYKIERPLELQYAKELDTRIDKLNIDLLTKAADLKNEFSSREEFEETFMQELNEHERILFKEFEHPISANCFDSVAFNNNTYMDMWTMSSSFLLATTTLIPVGLFHTFLTYLFINVLIGYGLITPRSSIGRLLLVLYAICGIPLALVTISDVGRFLCDFIFRIFKRSTKTAIWLLISITLLYPVIGGLIIWNYSTLNLVNSYYYCIITTLTIGFGDIPPPVPVHFLILFITCGVILMTVSIEVVGSNAIHQMHYMGRQVGKARHLAGRFFQMAHLNINTGLGLGMTQLSNLAKYDFLKQQGNSNQTEDMNIEWKLRDDISAFDPKIRLAFVDLGGDLEEF